MKTKELIAQLLEADPSGETEVVVDGSPVAFVERLPAYYDGDLHCYPWKSDSGAVGYKITDKGEKVLVRSISTELLIFDDPNLLVEIDTRESTKGMHENFIENCRKEAKEL